MSCSQRSVRTMVAKKQVQWNALAKPTTPSQMREYADACKEWLLEAVQEEPVVRCPSTPPIAYAPQHCNNLGVPLEQIHPNNHFECFACKKNGFIVATQGRIVQANPFTCACAMLVCEECQQAHFLRQ